MRTLRNTFSFRGWSTGVVLLGLLLILSTGCAGDSRRAKLQELKLAPLDEMPVYVQEAQPEVQEAYRFALANPDLLKQIPCFCGCNALGHQNNFECYVDSAGQPVKFDNHAAF